MSEFVAFMSYTHEDDEHHEGFLTEIRKRLKKELYVRTRQQFDVFQDREAIEWGEHWKKRVEEGIKTSSFLIPIVTPLFFDSPYCRGELESFAQFEAQQGRDDLILPIYFVRYSPLEFRDEPADELVRLVKSRNWIDWTKLRNKSVSSSEAREAVAALADRILLAMERIKSPHSEEKSPSVYSLPSTRRVPRATQAVRDRVLAVYEFVPAGEFWMGSEHSPRSRELGRHRVAITEPLYVSKTQVTVSQFQGFVESTNYQTEAERRGRHRTWSDPGHPQTEHHPVTYVSWNDARAYCSWLSEMDGFVYRLPTEAEWEYACRAGSEEMWFFGDEVLDLSHYAWFRENSEGSPRPAGMKSSSPFGLVDIHGNVWEWCLDWYGAYPKGGDIIKNPKGAPRGRYRVTRGGSWTDRHEHTTCSFRIKMKPFQSASNLGFRVVRELN
jgi:formylglycine-generating enzyme required for sulfatase activity